MSHPSSAGDCSVQVYGVATEDMDALTFGAPVLVRHMTFSEARKEPIVEFNLKTVLEELNLSQDEVAIHSHFPRSTWPMTNNSRLVV
jgi:hypothetical protein